MAKLKNGDLLTCEVCGLVVVVDEACGCAVGEIICCKDTPMVKGKAAAAKAKKKEAVKPAAKPAAAKAIKGKTSVPAKAAKPASKAKTGVKKPAAKKPSGKARK
ncbi:MAG: hypothetical protein NTZ24_10965 [Deltaproteobacteria bacterium]|nr:hypothetical protein [Deltaproteobacteria bacterium]